MTTRHCPRRSTGSNRLPVAASWCRLVGIVLAFLIPSLAPALPAKLGDLDEDGVPTILDVAKLAAHFRGTHPLTPQVALFADMNQDGALNEADQEALASDILQLTTPRDLPLTSIRETSPTRGEADVAVTRETILHFAHPLSPFTSIDTNRFRAEFGGRKVLSCVELARDRKKVTLFYHEPLPSNARVIVTFDGNGLLDLLGRPLDVDGDGQPGGVFTTEFETISTQPVPGTGVTGIVYASERGTGGTEVPLAGVTITVDGAEETLRTTTAADGSFTLTPCPSGVFFVHIDGRTSPVSNYPDGDYFPSVGKKWFATPGRMDNPAGDIDDTPTGGGTGVIYLPCICAGTLNTVSPVSETVITFPPSVVAANPALAGTEIRVPANSLFADDGTRGGEVGIAPVAPDRLPSPLPPGLNPPLVFTVQSDGATNFDQPVPVCLPNLPDPVTGKRLEPGAKSALFSFNHDTGEWEIAGSMTVSEDGECVMTDSGVGIRQPGWHVSQPGCVLVIKSPKKRPPCMPKNRWEILQYHLKLFNHAKTCLKAAGKTVRLAEKLYLLAEKTSKLAKFIKAAEDLRKTLEVAGGPVNCEFVRNAIKNVALIYGVILDADGLPKKSWKDEYLDEDASTYGDYLAAAECIPAIIRVLSDMCEFIEADQCLTGPAQQLCALIVRTNSGAIAVESFLNSVVLGWELDLMERGIQHMTAFIADFLKLYCQLQQPAPPDNDPEAIEDYSASLSDLNSALERFHMAGESVSSISDLLPELEIAEKSVFYAIDQLGTDNKSSSHYKIEVSGIARRGMIRENSVVNLIVPPDSSYIIQFADGQNGEIAITEGVSSSAGFRSGTDSQPYYGSIVDSTDGDLDGLSDTTEIIIGTNPQQADTDNDGIADLAAFLNATGSNNSTLTGSAAQTKVATSAGDISAGSRTLAVACGTEGTAFLATQGIAAPVMRTRVPTSSLSSAVSMGADAALVAESEAGFRCVSLDGSLNVTFQALVPVAGRAVSAVASGGIGYGGTSNGSILELDLASGGVLRQLETGAGDVEDLAVQGDWLFARKPDRLLAIPLNNPSLSVAGQLTLSTGRTPSSNRLRIAVADGRVFCTRGNGLQIVNTAALPALTLAGTVTGPGADWRHFVPNGNVGLLAGTVVSGGAPGARLPAPASLFTIPAAGNTASFATSFDMPGLSRAVALNRGIGYVISDNGSLAVVNYLDFDRARLAPGITLSSNINLASATPQVEEGSVMRLSAAVTDDVQVGNVEFHVDGVLAFDDTAYPFEHRFLAPRRSLSKTSFTVRARAVDTGGNATWSTEYTITLLPDTVAPTVRNFLPFSGTMHRTVENVYLRFSELMDSATLAPPGLTLIAAGSDGLFDTGDDVTIPYFAVYRDTDSLARLALNSPLPRGLYRLRAAPPVADATGNVMASAAQSIFRVYDLTDTDSDGIPDDWETLLGNDPNLADSDNDGTVDGLEDRDNDGSADGVEIVRLVQDPRVADANGNGIADGQEDSDSDGLRDGLEANAGTNHLLADTDGDGLDDATELAAGQNPLVSNLPLTATAGSPLTSALNAAREITPVIPTTARGNPIAVLNAAGEITPVIPTSAQSPPTSVLNSAREITPAIPTPAKSGKTSFQNQ